MPSLTASQMNRLGDRLRRSVPVNPADVATLQRIRAEYFEPTNAVQRLLRERLGLESTSRVKTETTIVEKLVREKTRLSTMQDIGGVRVSGPWSLSDQTTLAERIAAVFPDSRIHDLRTTPHYGYRAVHVIVRHDGRPVEIQVRTERQHMWAETMEKFADRFGRGLRYGETIKFVGEDGATLPAEAQPVQRLIETANSIAKIEVAFQEGEADRTQLRETRAQLRSLRSLAPPDRETEIASLETKLEEVERARAERDTAVSELDVAIKEFLALLATMAERADADAEALDSEEQ